MTEELKKSLDEFAEEMKKGLVTPAALDEKLKGITARIEELAKSEDVAELKAALKEQGEALQLLKKGRKSQENTVDEQIKAFIENPDNIAKAKGGQGVAGVIKVKDAGAILTSGSSQAISLVNTEVDRTIHSTPTEENAVFARVSKGATSSPNIAWVNRVNGEGGAAFIAEGTLKPLKEWSYEGELSTAKKAAVSTKVSTEMLSDAPFMRSEIDRLLREDLMQEVNAKILTGNGEGVEPKGITSGAAGYAVTALNGAVERPNYGDAIRAAILQIRQLNFKPNTLFINPADKALIDLTKDNTGHYISAEIQALFSGVVIVETTNVDAGKFLLMDSSRWHVRPYENLTIRYGFEDDDFRKNLVTVIAEMRLHSYQSSVDAGSIVYDSFATVMAAIEKAA
uniref:phage major capsid protein n=1 Tax=Alistipes sp. TaxID=1872444 RepID=UPI004056C62C